MVELTPLLAQFSVFSAFQVEPSSFELIGKKRCLVGREEEDDDLEFQLSEERCEREVR